MPKIQNGYFLKIRIILLLVIWVFVSCSQVHALGKNEHVFIVSFDGGKPTVMQESNMPTLREVIKEGASTWQAQTIFPSITLTAHTSMLTGLSPEKHKVLWNDWEPEHGVITVPTIFSLARKEGLVTAMFVGKPKFIHLLIPHSVNNFSLPSYDSITLADVAAKYIEAKKPNLCFIHFADSDGAGHEFGWGSVEQKHAFADEDIALTTVMHAIKTAGIEKSSIVILTADHGGHAKTHGTRSKDDMDIPWIAWGDRVKHGYNITAPVTTYDTAATALWLLGVPLPKDLDGHPVVSAFEESSP